MDDDDGPLLTQLKNQSTNAISCCSRVSVLTGILFVSLLIGLAVIIAVITLPSIQKRDSDVIYTTPSASTVSPTLTSPIATTTTPLTTTTASSTTAVLPTTAINLPPSGVDPDILMDMIRNISIVRPADSPNIKKVRTFLKSCFDGGSWLIEEDTFTADAPAPLGKKEFRNIIATLNPNAPKRIILSAHYDSKLFTDREFEGATDSAAPCGIMCYLAKYHFRDQVYRNITLQMVFFDGEEAFVSWTATDSLYGARHLASKWQKENALASIETLVLLDLLGSVDTNVQPLSERTRRFYEEILQIQADLITSNITRKKKYFQSFPSWPVAEDPYTIQDDHIPFLTKGVPVVHLISNPFPKVWHTERDNFAALDRSTCHDLAAIMWRFLKAVLV